MKKLFLFILVAVSATKLQAQTYSDSLTLNSPTFSRPYAGTPPSSIVTAANSPYGDVVYYRILSVPITVAGTYTFSATSLYDNFGILYNTTGFSPSSPLTNVISAVDDASGLDFSITETLAVGSYTLVVTTYENGINGPFSINATGPASVTLSGGTPLPLHLLSFGVKKAGNQTAAITWATAQEEGVSHFEVEKSTDGLQYITLNLINAKGNDRSGQQTYSVKDNSVLAGQNYYRLKMVDISGATTYSNTSVITGEGHIDYARIYPNPAGETVYFSYTAAQNADATFTIVDVTGRVISSQVHQLSKGTNHVPLNLSGFPAANYLVRWNCGTEAGTLTVVKH